jgi:AcrR family transcriptional regulator
MTKKSKSYLTIIASAKTLFWKHGIKKVSVEEISLAAGVSKMTFYRSFSNKEEVAEIILTDLIEKGHNDYRKIMAKEIPFESKLQEIIKLKSVGSKEVSQEFLKDIFINPDSKLATFMRFQSEKSNKMFEADLKKAQKNGELREGLKIEFILYMMGNIYHLMEDEKLINLFDDSVDLTVEIANFFFYGMLKPNVS